MAVLTRGFAEARGTEMALADDEKSVSFGEFDPRVNQLIHALRANDLRPGDMVAILCGNCNEWFEMAMACSNAGMTFVPVNWHLVATESVPDTARCPDVVHKQLWRSPCFQIHCCTGSFIVRAVTVTAVLFQCGSEFRKRQWLVMGPERFGAR